MIKGEKIMNNILRKYFIMGSQNCHQDHEPQYILQEAIKGGITAFQYREKGKGSLAKNEKIELGLKLRQLCHENNIPFFINDDIDLIETLDVDGIHVGQDDISVYAIRKRYPNIFIGLSISNKSELKNSPIDLVDYVGAGPVYSTMTKDDAKEAVGLNWIKTLKQQHPTIPIVAIGGINEKNAPDVLQAGADGIAVISAITKAKDIQKTVEML